MQVRHTSDNFNYPLCYLPERARELAVQSISDWKITIKECDECTQKPSCAGYFSSSKAVFINHRDQFYEKFNFAALLPGFLALNNSVWANDSSTGARVIYGMTLNEHDLVIAPLNTEVPFYIAGHRSHSSHREP